MSETTLQNGYYYGDYSDSNNGTVANTAPPLAIGPGATDVIAADTEVKLGGVAENAGTLALQGNPTAAAYLIILGDAVQGGVTYDTTLTLEGGGTLLLSDTPDDNFIGEDNAYGGAVLINVDNTITGAGQFENFIYNNGVAVTNEQAGIIDASGVNALLISEGAIVFPLINNGLMEATNTGGLIFSNQQVQQFAGGTLLADGGGHNIYLEDNSDINGGVLRGTDGGLFIASLSTAAHDSGDTLDGSTVAVTLAAGTGLVLDDNLLLRVLGTIDNQGTIMLAGSANATVFDLVAPAVSLTGGGELLFSDSAYNEITNANNGNLINVNNTIAGAGVMTNNGNSGGFGVTNQSAGVIDATGTLNQLILQGGTYGNAGLVEATGAAGLVLLDATLDQSAGGALLVGGAADNVYLEDAVVIGGTLAARVGDMIQVAPSRYDYATFDGTTAAVQITAGTDVQVDDAQLLNLLGTIVNQGTIMLAGNANATVLELAEPGVTLTGGGELLLGDNANNVITSINDGTLINVNNTIAGAGVLNSDRNAVGFGISNQLSGIIDATGTSNQLILQSGTYGNAGLIEATGAAGMVLLETTLDQSSGGTLVAAGTADNVYLEDAVVIGGTLAASTGDMIQVASSRYDYATFEGTNAAVEITAGTDVQVDDGQVLNLLGTIVNAGSIVVDSTLDSTGIVAASATVALVGGGQVMLSDDANNYISANNELININDIISGAGAIAGITNQSTGTIEATGTFNALMIGGTTGNAGLMAAIGVGGLIVLNAILDQTGGGTIAALGAGHDVLLEDSIIAGGTFASSNGGRIEVAPSRYDYATFDGTTAAVQILSGTDVQVDDSQVLNLQGTIDNAGSIVIDSTLGATGIDAFSATVVLQGAGQVILSDNANNYISANNELFNVDDTISGAGAINGITNQSTGIIAASGALNALTIGGTNGNEGLLEATGTAGLVILNATIDQSGGGTIAADGFGNNVYLEDSAITGGTYASHNGGIIEVAPSRYDYATFDGTTAAVHIATGAVVEIVDGQVLNLLGTLVNQGSLVLAGTADSTILALSGATESLTGGGVIILQGAGNQIGYVGYTGSGDRLLNVDNTIEGAGRIGGGGDSYFTNQSAGVVDANSRTGSLALNNGILVNENDGLFKAQSGGSLDITSKITFGATGTVAALDSSAVVFDGNVNLLNDAAGTLTGGTYEAVAQSGTASVALGGNEAVQVDAANILLSGTDALFTTDGMALAASLTEIAGSGTLQLANLDYEATGNFAVDDGGRLLLAGATFGGGTLANAGSIAGYGTITAGIGNTGKIAAAPGGLYATADVANNGTIAVTSGAVLEIAGNLSGTGLVIVDPAIATLNGTVSSGQTISLVGTGNQLNLGDIAAFAGAITGYGAGDTLDIAGLTATRATYANGVLTLSDASGHSVSSFGITGNSLTSNAFVLNSDQQGGTEVTDVACFCPGTRIRTVRGQVAVEKLKIGDRVKTMHHGLQRVKWVGMRHYASPFIGKNPLILPVCIKADALGAGIPVRDLWVSPGHAICMGDVLVHASRLVNGVSIIQAQRVESVSYYHIELDMHAVIYAEGCPAETFMDEHFRQQFQNAASFAALYPGAVAPQRPCLPRLDEGFELWAIQRRVARAADVAMAMETSGPLRGMVERAALICSGWAQSLTQPDVPVSMIVTVGGVYAGHVLANAYRDDLRKAGCGDGCHGFSLALPPGLTGPVRVCRASDGAALLLSAAAMAA